MKFLIWQNLERTISNSGVYKKHKIIVLREIWVMKKYLLLTLFLLDSFFVFSQGIGFLGKITLKSAEELKMSDL